MRRVEPKATANERKLAKIAKLESLVEEATAELFANFPLSSEMQWWKIEKLQEIVDAEIDSTYRRDEVLFHRLYLARKDVARARNEDARRAALIRYETAKFDAIAWPYHDVEHSRYRSGLWF